MRKTHRLLKGKRTKRSFMTAELRWTEHCCQVRQGTFVISAGRGVFLCYLIEHEKWWQPQQQEERPLRLGSGAVCVLGLVCLRKKDKEAVKCRQSALKKNEERPLFHNGIGYKDQHCNFYISQVL